MIDKSKINIKQMALSDLQKIKDILLTDFDDFWNFEIFKDELANNNSSYLALLYDDEIVCFGGIKIILDEANLMDIVTRKDMRHKGFAKILLNELIILSKEKKCKTITLEVNENNLNAINLYKSFKFEEVGKRKRYYQNGDNAILMTYKI